MVLAGVSGYLGNEPGSRPLISFLPDSFPPNAALRPSLDNFRTTFAVRGRTVQWHISTLAPG